MEARCQCGKVKFTTPTPAPLTLYACHCLECRHQSSSAFGISAIFPVFTLPASTSDDVGIYGRKTDSGGYVTCYFCKHCGSRLLHAGSKGKTVSVKGGCLEGLTKEMVSQACHIWTKRAVVPIPEGRESFEEEPPD